MITYVTLKNIVKIKFLSSSPKLINQLWHNWIFNWKSLLAEKGLVNEIRHHIHNTISKMTLWDWFLHKKNL